MAQSNTEANRALVVTVDAFRFSTRARKSALAYARRRPVTFLGLSAAGRTGRWDKSGCWQAEGITVNQLHVRRPVTGTTRICKLRNGLLCYLPAYIRLSRAVLQTPAQVIHVTGIPLGWLGLIHKARYSSRFVLDITERPGMVISSGSLAATFRYIEPFIIKTCSRSVDIVSVVTPDDIDVIAAAGYRRVLLVRNAPPRAWRASYRAPEERGCADPIVMSLLGSIFEGRGHEMVIQSLGRARRQGANIRLRIIGPGREGYVRNLRDLAMTEGVDDAIEWREPIERAEVSAEYLRGHVGLVVYEATDPGNDGLPNKLMECVASGRPVLATDLPQSRRFVVENDVGWVAHGDVESFSNAMLALREVDFRAMSLRCREIGDAWLNWESEFVRVERSLDLLR